MLASLVIDIYFQLENIANERELAIITTTTTTTTTGKLLRLAHRQLWNLFVKVATIFNILDTFLTITT